ncbi:hypothetical protein TNCV_4033841 [Trichonephila clavipes]|nr:hypothetical protein TNCV_4033841 [Trichonephila clavipes]
MPQIVMMQSSPVISSKFIHAVAISTKIVANMIEGFGIDKSLVSSARKRLQITGTAVRKAADGQLRKPATNDIRDIVLKATRQWVTLLRCCVQQLDDKYHALLLPDVCIKEACSLFVLKFAHP